MAKTSPNYYAPLEIAGPMVITRDGKDVSPVVEGSAAFSWLLRHQGQSVEYALRYGGYSARPATPAEIETKES